MHSSTFNNLASTSEKHKLLGLDHLRALAITYVLLFHYQLFGHPDWVNSVGGFGWTGVDLFFVLSGFLIAGQLFGIVKKGRAISMREFFIKRFFRIIPPYLVVLGLYTFVPFLREREHMASLWRYLTFTLNFGLDLRTTGTFTHAWSLCVEEQFYLILPLTFWVITYLKAGKKTIYILPGILVLGFIVRYASWHYWVQPHLSDEHFGSIWHTFIYYPTYCRLDGLLIGVGIAGAYTFYPRVKELANKYSNLLMFLGLIVLIAAYFICKPESSFNTGIWGFPVVSLGYGIIVAAMVCPSNVLFNLKSIITAQLATLSYGIYLSHKLVIAFMQNVLEKTGIARDSNLMMMFCITGSIAGALILRYVIEKPSLKIRDKILNKWKYNKTHKPVETAIL
ncbi:acyltransferase [Mucilaginibacter sabulilitoris]|uniref:Acyltransferase n=1 Tax=Mucilaginibacter sabulilitoris TaxID=1173583 RepID=A0ABZ0TJR1_9SPHI|nr:acyltransferase [Mucilaginibacter sabulilitoris]WPU93268.1 acyltransferase [Mucilaginibacter sabulilitoris]